MEPRVSDRKRVVIIGGGFAGLTAARKLRHAPVEVTLIDKRNFHLFQPLLYQVATGGLSPADIASPLRAILNGQQNVTVVQRTVTDIDLAKRLVIAGSEAVAFDYLLVATGAKHHYFGNDSWEGNAPGLKTLEDALNMRRCILSAFEQAEVETDTARQRALLTFVVVGGGPTGVELAGALGELAHHTLRNDFRAVDPAESKILLVEGTDRLLPTYTPSLSKRAVEALTKLGVSVRTNTLVENIHEGRVTLLGRNGSEEVHAETILWAAGVKGSALGRCLAEATGADIDRQGRVLVQPDLSLAHHPDIFVLGDLAYFEQDDDVLPGIAPVAMQQGAYVAKLIQKRLHGGPMKPFRYKDRGCMAVIGRAAAVAQVGWLRFHGLSAWLVWLFVHLINLVEYQNRVLVLIQWGWNYFTRNRSARIITNQQEVMQRPASENDRRAKTNHDDSGEDLAARVA